MIALPAADEVDDLELVTAGERLLGKGRARDDDAVALYGDLGGIEAEVGEQAGDGRAASDAAGVAVESEVE